MFSWETYESFKKAILKGTSQWADASLLALILNSYDLLTWKLTRFVILK